MAEEKEKKESSNSTQIKKNLFLDTYFLKVCNISATCKGIGIDRKTFYNWKKDDNDFAEKAKEVEESLMEMAESQLFKNITSGKEASLFFYLCNRSPERWKNIQKVEHTGEIQIGFDKLVRMLEEKKQKQLTEKKEG